jgi:hypothetical protein
LIKNWRLEVIDDKRTNVSAGAALIKRHDLYTGVKTLELETLLARPEQHIEFYIWYLKEEGWSQRTDNSIRAITATGVAVIAEGHSPEKGSSLTRRK